MKRNSIVGIALLLVVMLGLVFGSCTPSIASTPQLQPPQAVDPTPLDPKWSPPMVANQPSLTDLSQVVEMIRLLIFQLPRTIFLINPKKYREQVRDGFLIAMAIS